MHYAAWKDGVANGAGITGSVVLVVASVRDTWNPNAGLFKWLFFLFVGLAVALNAASTIRACTKYREVDASRNPPIS